MPQGLRREIAAAEAYEETVRAIETREWDEMPLPTKKKLICFRHN